MNDVKDTIDVDTTIFREILEDGMKPRTIKEIKEKYELSFPFKVKRVVEICGAIKNGEILNVQGTMPQKITELDNSVRIVVAGEKRVDPVDGKLVFVSYDEVEAWVFYS